MGRLNLNPPAGTVIADRGLRAGCRGARQRGGQRLVPRWIEAKRSSRICHAEDRPPHSPVDIASPLDVIGRLFPH